MKKGYVVIESCEDYEQILCLKTGEEMPAGGILCWPGEGFVMRVFANRRQARSAINRTHHYAKAFDSTDMPEKKYCKIHPVVLPET